MKNREREEKHKSPPLIVVPIIFPSFIFPFSNLLIHDRNDGNNEI